jgi:hypothetical protein
MKQSNMNTPEKEQNTSNLPGQNEPIDARDASRNAERDQRIKEEPDTERLHSERESTMNRDPE